MIYKNSTFILAAVLLIWTSACSNSQQQSETEANPTLTVSVADFEGVVDEIPVALYTLTNGQAVAAITNYGARVISLHVPDKKGELVDVVLGYQDLAHFQDPAEGFYGAIVGRYGNRIAKGQFTLEGESYQLEVNNGPNSLHGGHQGFSTKAWEVSHVSDSSITLRHLSPDGEAGYPGTLDAIVTYTLTEDHGLDIHYRATTDKATVVNLTNHAYFNLSGEGEETILDHVLTIHADGYTPVDETLIPTGEIASVENTPFDFREPTPIGEHIDDAYEQISFGGGYDHNFVLNKPAGLQLAARVSSPKTGIVMDVLTEEPGLQFYSGNYMDNIQGAKGGKVYGRRSAFCLEAQHFPDSPNQTTFPSTVLQPGETYETRTIYRFSAQ